MACCLVVWWGRVTCFKAVLQEQDRYEAGRITGKREAGLLHLSWANHRHNHLRQGSVLRQMVLNNVAHRAQTQQDHLVAKVSALHLMAIRGVERATEARALRQAIGSLGASWQRRVSQVQIRCQGLRPLRVLLASLVSNSQRRCLYMLQDGMYSASLVDLQDTNHLLNEEKVRHEGCMLKQKNLIVAAEDRNRELETAAAKKHAEMANMRKSIKRVTAELSVAKDERIETQQELSQMESRCRHHEPSGKTTR